MANGAIQDAARTLEGFPLLVTKVVVEPCCAGTVITKRDPVHGVVLAGLENAKHLSAGRQFAG